MAEYGDNEQMPTPSDNGLSGSEGNTVKVRHPLKSMHSHMHEIAEELRLEGKGSEDPAYKESHKNK